MGRDYELAKELSVDFPAKPTLYGWNGVSRGVLDLEEFTPGVPSQSTTSRHAITGVLASKLTRVGSTTGSWMYDPSHLNEKSIVYSVGLGLDTSWDEAIMDRHNLQVWGFDPTPKAVAYVQSRKELQIPNFHLVPEALSSKQRRAIFTLPANPDHVNMREGAYSNLGERIEVPTNTLENWMKTNGHSHLDILKMDIEGSEYNVVEDWLARDFFPFDQFLVRWHFRVHKNKQRHFRLLSDLKSRGWSIAYNSANGQEMTFLRASQVADATLQGLRNQHQQVLSPGNSMVDLDAARELLGFARRISGEHGVVLIQILNEGFVEMTKSWICNVQRFPGVLSKLLFIATDEAAYNAIRSFHPSVNVVKLLYHAPKNLSYGQHAYFSFMLFRTKLLLILLEHDVTLFLIESDSLWLEDPTNLVLLTPGDMVTMSDTIPPETFLQGGFQLLRPTSLTMNVWKKMLRRLNEVLKKSDGRDHIGDEGSEQHMLNALIQEEPGLQVGWLPREYFVPGVYYNDPEYAATITNPKVILNNWIVGTDKKIERAKKWKHWFLAEDGQCDLITATTASSRKLQKTIV
jgi:FkbM family methyltransferase